MPIQITLKVLSLTTIAMIAFAANSIIARIAMIDGQIGQWSYTSLRLLSGALVLVLIVGPVKSWRAGSWISSLALLAYAGLFSLGYLSLSIGTGALILFTAVQFTMVGYGWMQGERINKIQTTGVVLAFVGVVFLLKPGIQAPDIYGALLMTGSGIGWGIYSLRGRHSKDPTLNTSGNFLKAAICALCLALPILYLQPETSPQMTGVILAAISGAVTSGLGYVVWYMALRNLGAIQAGLAQLTVPAIAAAGGVLFLSETLTARFLISSIIIFVGVAFATVLKPKSRSL